MNLMHRYSWAPSTKVKAALFLILCIGQCALIASTNIIVSNETRKENVLSQASIFIDHSRDLTLNEIFDAHFQPYKKNKLQYGFSNEIIWFTFSVENKSSVTKNVFLELNYKELDYVDLYEVRDNVVVDSMYQGDMRLSKDILENSFFPLFKLRLQAEEKKQYYLKVKSSSSLLFEAFLWDQVSYFTYINIHDKFLWFFIGFQFLRLVYVIIISRFIPQSYFKWYAYVILVMVIGIMFNSVNLKTFSLNPEVANQLILSIHYLLPFVILLWVKNYVGKYIHKRVYQITYHTLLYFQPIGLIGVLFLFRTSWYIQFSYCFMVFTFLMIIAFLIKIAINNQKIERRYIIPIIFLIVCNIPYTLIGLNILPYSQVTLIITGALVSTEVITMSILVGYLMKDYINKNIESVQHLLKIRDQISTDLHDELGSVLTQISLQSDLVKSNIYDEKQKNEELNKISKISREAIQSMSDFVWNVKPENDILSSLLDRMRDHADIMLAANGIEVKFESKGIDLSEPIESTFRQEIFMIFKEAVTNILKHGGSNQVNIKIQNDPKFYLSIKNDVTKLNVENKLGGNGLKHIQKRSSKIGLTATIDKRHYSFELIIRLE